MRPIDAPSVPLSQVGRAAHDPGVAGLLGGNLFARIALHPSVTEISDEAERGKVVNAAWRRYGTVNTLGLAAVIAGWVGARSDEAADRGLSPEERNLARAKDALVGIVAAAGIASAVQGMLFARKAPGGAVPLPDGDHTAPSASIAAPRATRPTGAAASAPSAPRRCPRRQASSRSARRSTSARSAVRPRAVSCLAWAAC